MYAQVQASLARAQGGLGIGLTLVNRLVEMHEGRIDGQGKGSVFVVLLPLIVEASSPKAAAAEVTPTAAKSSLRILIGTTTATAPTRSDAAAVHG